MTIKSQFNSVKNKRQYIYTCIYNNVNEIYSQILFNCTHRTLLENSTS